MCLYLDAYIPKVKDWVRIDMEVVRRDNENRMEKKSKQTDRKILMTTESGSDCEDQ